MFLVNGDSFANLDQYRQMPFDRWNTLIEVYNDVTALRNEAMPGGDD